MQSLTVCEIFAKQEKCQTFNLDNKVQGQRVEERDLRHSTENVGMHTGDLSPELYLPGNIRLRKLVTHTDRNGTNGCM